jgi:hypothetical protein
MAREAGANTVFKNLASFLYETKTSSLCSSKSIICVTILACVLSAVLGTRDLHYLVVSANVMHEILVKRTLPRTVTGKKSASKTLLRIRTDRSSCGVRAPLAN